VSLVHGLHELHEDGDVLLKVDVGRQLVEVQLDPSKIDTQLVLFKR
jgi:hypothetical protein